MNDTHLTQEERYQIYALLREGFSKHHIALRLERAPSTICREIKRNQNRNGYFARHAHKLVTTRHNSNHKTVNPAVWRQIKSYLALQWSPEQIASYIVVSMHSIYRYILQDKIKGGHLYQHLRFRNQRKRKHEHPEAHGKLNSRRSIHEKSQIIHQQSRFGDLEIDTIVGKNLSNL